MDEIEQARKGIPSSLQSGKEWQSRGGSYFTPTPLGSETKIAFVYPGAFNSYIGMGAELLHVFPLLHDWLSEHNENPAEIYQAENLFPKDWGKVSEDRLEEMQMNLLNHPLSMLFSGTAIAGMYTYLLEEIFNVVPDAAYGYSLGEIMMFFATGYWHKTEPIKKEITESDLYKNRIAGSMDAVREFWDQMGFSYTDSEIIWNNMILMTNVEKVKEAVEKEPLVYLTHVNTHRQVVIGGEPEACQRVVNDLGCMRFPIPVNYPMHCAPVASEFETLRDLNLQPVEQTDSIKFYSSYNCGPYQLESNAIAETVAGGLVNRVDFDALTKRVYEDGYRFFIEVGARSNCSKWIERSLKSEMFCAVSVNQAEIADEICLMKVIARLISHGKSVNLPVVNTNGAL
jgi:PfaB family protein